MKTRAYTAWSRIGIDAWLLGLEASTVVALRLMKMAAGGLASRTEMGRMVKEKVEAAAALPGLALTGGLGFSPASAASKTLKHYGRKVRANRKRLTKKKR